jgi:hypothetical protein
LPVYSSQRRPGLFRPGSALGVQPFKGFPSQEAALPYQLAHCPHDVSSHRPPAAMAVPAVGAPTRASRIRVGALLRLQGLKLPESPSASGVRVYVHRASFPSWASSSLRLSPRSRMERISPPLRSRAFANQTFGVAPKCPARWRPSVFLPKRGGIVSLETAWPLRGFTPPSFELL